MGLVEAAQLFKTLSDTLLLVFEELKLEMAKGS
jgi:hypothetical protein